MRLALGLEYDGTDFCGWQAQRSGVRTVQTTLEHALSKVANRRVAVVCAGRTDAGVHAVEQVVHFDCEADRLEKAWLLGTNSNLPPDVVVRWVQTVDEEFHARYEARSRRYRYLIEDGPTRPAIGRNRVAWHRQLLELAPMDEAAQVLVGTHDFSSFRASGCQAKDPTRRLDRIAVSRSGRLIVVDVVANAFLHHMVRIIVGSLLPIGRGERPVGWLTDVLDARDRREAGTTAAPCGLYLLSVRYHESFALPRSPMNVFGAL